MTDALLELSTAGADLAIADGDLARDEGLVTPILVSLFSDARAGAEDPLPAEELSRRGWWPDRAGNRWGSKLWLLAREKATARTAERARIYAQDALQWLVREGIADRVDVESAREGRDRIALTVRITRGQSRRWSSLWDATEGGTFRDDRLHLSILLA